MVRKTILKFNLLFIIIEFVLYFIDECRDVARIGAEQTPDDAEDGPPEVILTLLFELILSK